MNEMTPYELEQPSGPSVRPQEAPTSLSGTLGTLQQQAWTGFVAALPELLRHYEGKWVAFRGQEQLLPAATQSQAYQDAIRNGYSANELLVMRICPEAADNPEDVDLYTANPRATG
jgi:hypothetical protein